MKLFIVTEKIESRDWGAISFEVHGVWTTFEKALEYLKERAGGTRHVSFHKR